MDDLVAESLPALLSGDPLSDSLFFLVGVLTLFSFLFELLSEFIDELSSYSIYIVIDSYFCSYFGVVDLERYIYREYSGI